MSGTAWWEFLGGDAHPFPAKVPADYPTNFLPVLFVAFLDCLDFLVIVFPP